jgi:hypothetical protein
LAGAARRGLAFFGTDFLAAGLVLFATLVDFGKAFLLKARSSTVPKVIRRRQMFLACFVSAQSGFVAS